MKTVNNTDIDRHPDFRGGDKEAIRTSTSTTFRRRDPTNPHTASKVMNYVFDHSQQMRIWPDARPNSLIEATHSTPLAGSEGYKTMNKSGKPFALGVTVGGAPDQRGTTLDSKSPKAKFTK